MNNTKTKKLMAVKKKVKKAVGQEKTEKEKPIQTNKTEVVEKDELFAGLKRVAEFDAFIDWIALPSVYRKPETQLEWAKKYKVTPDLLPDWKKRNGFYEEVQRRRRRYFKDDSGDVILSLKRRCIKEGNGADVKVFLNYTEDLKDKAEVTVDDELKNALEKINKILPD